MSDIESESSRLIAVTFRDRVAFFVMPFKWIRRGCFDRGAARVAWFYAFVGRPSRRWK